MPKSICCSPLLFDFEIDFNACTLLSTRVVDRPFPFSFRDRRCTTRHLKKSLMSGRPRAIAPCRSILRGGSHKVHKNFESSRAGRTRPTASTPRRLRPARRPALRGGHQYTADARSRAKGRLPRANLFVVGGPRGFSAIVGGNSCGPASGTVPSTARPSDLCMTRVSREPGRLFDLRLRRVEIASDNTA